MRQLLLVALLLAAPLAGAEHTYAHRFVLEGRVVDANGLPVPDRDVTFFAEGDSFVEACPEGHQATTDAQGDFRFCFHKHELSARTLVGARVDGVEVRKPMDTAFRRTLVILRDPNATGVAPPGWNETYRISGKVWRGGAITLEGVPVYGLAIAEAPVNITLRTAAGESVLNVTTDARGDFDATLRLVNGATARDVRVEVESMGQGVPARLDAVSHRSTAGVFLPEDASTPDVVAQEPVARPGAGSAAASPLLIVGVLAAGIAAVAIARRKSR